jgi:diketogulonate reductase-like aldo/keto reductase
MSKLAINSVFALPKSDLKIPILGYGVYQLPRSSTISCCLAAINAGYRHFDSAQYYRNEAEVGEAVRESGLPRSELFVTTKIMRAAESVDASYKAAKHSVDVMGLGYIDLFLIHTPPGSLRKRTELWRALEQLQKDGYVKSIGVSNYLVKELEEMKSYATVFPPAVNQIELHPWYQQRDTVKWCQEHDVVIEAYCPIARNKKAKDPTLLKLAEKYGRSTAQILIRWSLQKGYSPLPKSENLDRIKENANVYDFELAAEDMAILDGLDAGERVTWI